MRLLQARFYQGLRLIPSRQNGILPHNKSTTKRMVYGNFQVVCYKVFIVLNNHHSHNKKLTLKAKKLKFSRMGQKRYILYEKHKSIETHWHTNRFLPSPFSSSSSIFYYRFPLYSLHPKQQITLHLSVQNNFFIKC